MCQQYDSIAKDLNEKISVSTLRDRWLIPFLELMDYKPVFQRAFLPCDDGHETFAISHLGWEGERATPLILIPSDLDQSSTGKRSPHDELQQYLNRTKNQWGVVANGRRLRLLRDFHHAHYKAYVEFDLDAIFETRDFPSFRALYRLVHRSRLEMPISANSAV